MTDWLGLHIGAATRTDATPAEFGSERPTVSRLPVDRRPMREMADAMAELMGGSEWLAKTECLACAAEPLLGPTPATHHARRGRWPRPQNSALRRLVHWRGRRAHATAAQTQTSHVVMVWQAQR